jgi:hypothetical protein
MACSRYGPLISRFLDEDLEKGELEGFLEHLFACELCQRDLKAFEKLQQGFQAVEQMDAVPEPAKLFSLSDLGAVVRSGAGAVPLAAPALAGERGKAKASRGSGKPRESAWLGTLSQYIFPQNFLRYAVPMIAFLLVGVWMYPDRSEDQVDVRELPASRSLSAHLAKQETDRGNVDLYLMQHAANQPWAQYGNDVPLVQRVAGSYP